jgi:transcriptional regulator with PAS, ATPase and Fis domain
VDHFIHRFNLKQNKNILGVRPEVIDLFMSHDFPGNVRELENLLEHAFILCHGPEIQLSHLPPDFLQALGEKAHHLPALPSIPLLRKTEAEVIVGVLHKNRGNRKKTAQELGIDKSTLWRKMKRLGIQS